MRNYIENLNENSRNGGLNRFGNNGEPNTVGAIGNQGNSFMNQNNRTSTSFAAK